MTFVLHRRSDDAIAGDPALVKAAPPPAAWANKPERRRGYLRPMKSRLKRTNIENVPRGGDKPKSMPLFTDRFARSLFMRVANNEQLGAAFRLWLLAWGEKPAGSLPNNDRWLSDAAKIDRQRWSSQAEVVLHGFVACDDGRLYHPVICVIA